MNLHKLLQAIDVYTDIMSDGVYLRYCFDCQQFRMPKYFACVDPIMGFHNKSVCPACDSNLNNTISLKDVEAIIDAAIAITITKQTPEEPNETILRSK